MLTDGWDAEVRRWFDRRTYTGLGRSAPLVAEKKRAKGLSLSLALPALNEAETIAPICRSIRCHLMEETGLVDELVVVDSGSTDETRDVAATEGATVFRAADILPELPAKTRSQGKGQALWKSLAVLQGDLIVWLDSDVCNFSPHFVCNLVWPLLISDDLLMIKAFYERPFADRNGSLNPGGARVTELAARPLLQHLYPSLAGLIQPLAGECACRRKAALELPFLTGYGVEIGLLIDVVQRWGLDVVGQADLGARVHRNQDLQALGRMAFQVVQAMLLRAHGREHWSLSPALPSSMVQFLLGDEGPVATSTDLRVAELPPMASCLKG